MSHNLFIQPHLNGASDELFAISWWDTTSKNQQLGDLDALQEFCAHTEFDQRILILPGELTTYSLVEAPTQNLKQAKQSIPFIMEENIASDIDDLLFAFGNKNDNQFPVIVVNRSLLTNWLDQFENFGLLPHVAVPDYQLLPVSGDNQINILLDGDRALIEGENIAATISLIALSIYLDATFSNPENDISDVRLLYSEDLNDLDILNEIKTICEQHGIEFKKKHLTHSVLEFFAEQYHRAHGSTNIINLLQSGVKSAQASGAGLFNWRPFAWAAAIWFGLQLLIDGSQAIYFNAEEQKLDAEVKQQYQELLPSDKNFFHYPKEKRLIYMEKFFDKNVNNDEQTGFLTLLSAASTQLKSMPHKEAISIHSFSYNERQQRLELDIYAKAVSSMEMFEQKMDSIGYKVDIGAARKDKDQYKAKLQVYM